MDDSIHRLSLRLLQDSIIIASWGIANTIVFDTHITFEVSGLKYKGKVEIRPVNQDEYEVLLGANSLGSYGIDSIVDTLDRAIEVTDDYKMSLEEWLKAYRQP